MNKNTGEDLKAVRTVCNADSISDVPLKLHVAVIYLYNFPVNNFVLNRLSYTLSNFPFVMFNTDWLDPFHLF